MNGPPRSGRLTTRGWIGVAVASALIVSVAVWWSNPGHGAAPSTSLTGLPVVARGTQAPPVSLPRLGGGQPVSSLTARGHPVVINFFASWCPNCAGELRAFASAARATRGTIVFIGVDSNDWDPGAAARMLARAGVTYPVGIDRSSRVTRSYLLVGVPTTVFVNRRGQIAGEAFGSQSAADLRYWIRRLEAE